MAMTTSDGQGSRTKRVTVTVTPFEKKAVAAVAAAMDTDESNLLRTVLLTDILVEYRKIREVVGALEVEPVEMAS